MRFALTELKLSIAHSVPNIVFEPSEKTIILMKFSDKDNFNMRPEGGLYLNLKRRY